jgi:mono/diheme cytochrome c family protein
MWQRSVSVLTFLLLSAMGAAFAEGELDAAAVFNSRCAACHTVGGGDDVGPDLKGVTERRDRSWLVPFIQSSQAVVGAGDPTALELFERYGRQKMPDHPYTADQIGEILDYIEAGGPASEPRIRLAASATPEEVRAGRVHFFGRSSEGASCASCHSVGGEGRSAGLYLGGSLAGTFSRYGDVELARALARSRGICRRALEPEESFLVRAYLRHLDESGGDVRGPARHFPALSFVFAALFLALPGLAGRAVRVPRGRRGPGEAP